MNIDKIISVSLLSFLLLFSIICISSTLLSYVIGVIPAVILFVILLNIIFYITLRISKYLCGRGK
jgi:hypothetical protein